MDTILRKCGIIRRRGGFTLVELIVVLVIIGILLALVIPNLTGYIDKAQATSCRKNRAELEKIYRYDTLLAKAEGSSTTMSAVLGSENGKKLTCPSGGTYTYNIATGRLVCSVSKHNAGIVSTNPIANGVLDVIDLLDINTNMYSGDSDGVNTKEFIAALKEKGLDFDSMGIKSWAYLTNNGMYWTEVDISTLTVDPQKVTTIPVMKYNNKSGSGYEGVYSIWYVRVLSNGSYNYIDDRSSNSGGDEYPASSIIKDLQTKKDYDTMNDIYQRALAEYNASH